MEYSYIAILTCKYSSYVYYIYCLVYSLFESDPLVTIILTFGLLDECTVLVLCFLYSRHQLHCNIFSKFYNYITHIKDIYAKFVATYMPLIISISCINVCFFFITLLFSMLCMLRAEISLQMFSSFNQKKAVHRLSVRFIPGCHIRITRSGGTISRLHDTK